MSAADDGRSLGQLVASATTELSVLVHDEVALAKAELRGEVRRALSGGATAVIAGVFALFALPLLSFGAAYGIHNLGIGLAWSFTIVGAAYVVLALSLLLLVRSRFRSLSAPRKTLDSMRGTAEVLSNVRPHPRGAHGEERAQGGAREDGPEVESVTRSTV